MGSPIVDYLTLGNLTLSELTLGNSIMGNLTLDDITLAGLTLARCRARFWAGQGLFPPHRFLHLHQPPGDDLT